MVLLYISLLAAIGSVLFGIVIKQLLDLFSTIVRLLLKATIDEQDEDHLNVFENYIDTATYYLFFLLMLSPLLFVCAIIAYTWKINLVVAGVIIGVICSTVPISALFSYIMLSGTLSQLRSLRRKALANAYR